MVTCEKMKELERQADAHGLSFYKMMENAGTCAAVIIMGSVPALMKGGSCLIICGKGNNGGDGFVAARRLAGYGVQVTVLLMEGPARTEDAITNFDLLDKIPNVVVTSKTPADLEAYDCIVDALYGTGFHGKLRSEPARLVSDMNRAQMKGTFVAALDIPSGLPGDMGDNDLIGLCVHADLTITFHDKKPVHMCRKAAMVLGEVTVADIGISDALREDARE
ncbi:MAG: NAD(P)H-hydrate epimerase [Anaerovoracaceae bacterium]|jgi:NAD(P)H-hydrate epimerase